MSNSLSKIERIFAPESGLGKALNPVGYAIGKSIRSSQKTDTPAAKAAEPLPTGALDDETAKKLAESTAFRRNMFLSPTAFVRGSLGNSTGRSVLNV